MWCERERCESVVCVCVVVCECVRERGVSVYECGVCVGV